MNNTLSWDDYRIVLQVAEAGSLSKAAQRAGSSHPTMFRKIKAVEDKLGVRLFERLRTGYEPTAAGEDVVAAARQMAELAIATERRLIGRDLRPSGTVCVATTDTLLLALLAPLIAQFRQVEPKIQLEVIASNDLSDLSLREADIAIRPVTTPDPHLVGRKLGVIQQAIYAPARFCNDGALEQSLETLPWVGPSRAMPYPQLHAWMRDTGYDAQAVCRVNTVMGLHAAVKCGVGLAVLPTYLAEGDRDLLRIGQPIADVRVDLWLLTHPDLRKTARVRAVLDYLAQADLPLARDS